jgi:DNA-binding CsgD family transcriptional regulator
MNIVIDNPNPPTTRSLQSQLHPSEEVFLQADRQLTFIQDMVMEGFIDGILILTEQGKVVYANHCARQLCRQLMQDFSHTGIVPQQIWHICQMLTESRSLFSEHFVILEDEICTSSTVIRLRVRWIKLSSVDQPCVSVTLEDRSQSLKNAAMAEARKYGLTAREAEVWLLRRCNCTYKAIAAELHIAIDTVKKHIKSINAKREAFQWANEEIS